SGLALSINSQPIPLTHSPSVLFGEASQPDGQLHFHSPDQKLPALLDELTLHSRQLHPLEIQHLYDNQALLRGLPNLPPAELQTLFHHTRNPAVRSLQSQLNTITQELSNLESAALPVPIAQTQNNPLSAADLPFTPPSATTPARLAFAHWLFHPDNPLTARVLANRIYQSIHNTSLLPDPDDLSDPWQIPTNRNLLDSLAHTLLTNNYQLRPLLKQILLTPPPTNL
ncbi:MAG: DUF1553 domain-containing protein, partial [Verrucomicrobiota bacterium]